LVLGLAGLELKGLELGDPCCIWKSGGEKPPTRRWQLSHPGDPKSVSGVVMPEDCVAIQKVAAQDDKTFWQFYFSGYEKSQAATQTWGEYFASFEFFGARIRGEPEPGRCGPSFNGTVCSVGCCSRGAWCGEAEDHCGRGCQSTYSKQPCNPLPWSSYLTLDLQDNDDFAKYKFTNILLGLTFLFFYMGTWRDFKEASWRKHLAFLVLSYLYVDCLSGFLHITLDNPKINHWPFIGKEAQSFQGHHYDPSAIARGGWFRFLQTVHAGQLLVTLSFVFNPKNGRLRMFLCWVNVMIPFMMAAHRWSHVPPAVAPWPVKFLQFAGLLITPEHHSVHHAHFDANFCILGGWLDPFLNFFSRYILGNHNPAWAFVLVAWGCTPAFLSYERIHKPLVSQLGRVYTQAESMVGRYSPGTVRRLRWLTGRDAKQASSLL
jgi:Lipid desaturase domain